MSEKILDGVRKIATQLHISAPARIDSIFAEHLLNQVSRRIEEQQEDIAKATANETEIDLLNERISAMSHKLDATLSPFLHRLKP